MKITYLFEIGFDNCSDTMLRSNGLFLSSSLSLVSKIFSSSELASTWNVLTSLVSHFFVSFGWAEWLPQFTFGEAGSEIDFECDVEGIITFSFVVILGILPSSERRANLISELFCGLNIRVRFASSTLRSRFGAAQIFTLSTFLEITSVFLHQKIDF